MKKGTGIYGSTKTLQTREYRVYVEGYGDIWEYQDHTRE